MDEGEPVMVGESKFPVEIYFLDTLSQEFVVPNIFGARRMQVAILRTDRPSLIGRR